MSRAAHTVVILPSRLPCFLAHRKELVLATARPWATAVLGPGAGGTERSCHSSGTCRKNAALCTGQRQRSVHEGLFLARGGARRLAEIRAAPCVVSGGPFQSKMPVQMPVGGELGRQLHGVRGNFPKLSRLMPGPQQVSCSW